MRSSQTRNALIASALSMFLCLAMFVSTSFAWFSDTASANVNKIVAGPLGGGQTTAGGTDTGNGEAVSAIAFSSEDEFSETAAGMKYSTKTFTAAGITCAADVYLETVPELADFRLTLEEAGENQVADFIITKNDDSSVPVKLILGGYSAGATSPALVIYFKDVKAVVASESGSYGFNYEFSAVIENENYIGLGGFYRKES